MSSLFHSGSGLFGTHVTFDDVSTVLQKELRDYLSPHCKMELVGDGNGFYSCVIHITCIWSSPSPFLPTSLALKIASSTHIQSLIEKFKLPAKTENIVRHNFEKSLQKMHNQEINFYNILEKSKNPKILKSRVFGSQKFDRNNKVKGFLVMEYLEGSWAKPIFENWTLSEIKPVLRAIAALQAHTFQISKINFEKIRKESWYEPAMISMMNGDGLRGYYSHLEDRYEEKLADRVRRLKNYGQAIMDFERAFNLNRKLGISHDVLVHGDLWSSNILWTKSGLSKIVDYQLAHTGNPAEDLVRFLCSVLSGKDRQNHWESILEQFYSYFLEEIRNGVTEPYSLDQLKQSYRLFFPVGGLALLPLFGPSVDRKLECLEKKESAKYQNQLMEKIQCLLEDVELFYLKNEHI